MKYNNTFVNTIIPLGSSKEIEDMYGSSCWKYVSEKAIYDTTMESLRTNENTQFVLLVEYYDNQSGYLRIDYDNNRVETDATIATLTGSDTWKFAKFIFDGRLQDICDPGAFRLYVSSTESTTADQDYIVRAIAIEHDETRSILQWQSQGVPSLTRETYALENSRIPVVGDSERMIQLIRPQDIIGSYYGMRSLGSSLPLYFLVAEDDSAFWRENTGRSVDIEVMYYDNGTDDILLEYMTPDGLQSDVKLVTKTNRNVWKTSTISLKVEATYTTLYLQSNTTNESDPIIDLGPHGLTVQRSNPSNIHHETSEKAVGESSIYFTTGQDILTILEDVSTRFNIGSGEFTLEYWIKGESTSARISLGPGSDPQPWNGWWVDHNGMSSANWVDIDGTWWGSNVGVGDTSWHHYAWTCNGSKLAVWRDGGIEYNTRSYSSIGTVSDPNFYISNMGGGVYPFYIDDVHLEIGYARYDVNSSTISYPTGLISEDLSYSISDTNATLLSDASIEGSDLKIYSSGGSSLYLSRIVMTEDNNAVITWKP